MHINFSDHNISARGRSIEKSDFLVKKVEVVLVFGKNINRYVKTSEKGRKFQILSISLFFHEYLGFPLLEGLAENKEEDISQMFLLNCLRPLQNDEKM